MRISRRNFGKVEWPSQVADIEVHMIKLTTLSKDVGPHKTKVFMATEIWIYLPLSSISVWIPLAVEANSVTSSCIIDT